MDGQRRPEGSRCSRVNASMRPCSSAGSRSFALSPGAFTLFATHYLQLANLRNLYPGHVKTLVLGVEPAESRLRFLYTVKEGVAHKRQYMTDFLAQLAGFPPSVCDAARRLSAAIDFDPVDAPNAQAQTLEAYARVAERLVWLRRSTTMDEEAQRTFLINSVAVKQEADEEKKWADNHMSAVNIFASDHFSWEAADLDRKRIAEEERQKQAKAAAKKAKKPAPKKANA